MFYTFSQVSVSQQKGQTSLLLLQSFSGSRIISKVS
jgi:hypothetical protein